MIIRLIKYVSILTLILWIGTSACAQKLSFKEVFKDTTDGALDMSRFLIDLHGFLPVPMIITEPALGNFGGGLMAVFLKKRPAQIDTVRGHAKVTRTPPDMTGVGVMYTANNSWALMGFRRGTWMKMRSKYSIAGGLTDINLSFYRTLSTGKEVGYEFNLKSTPVIASLEREIKGTYWSGGLQYTFLNTKLKSDADVEFISDKEFSSIVSMPAAIIDFDGRDNIFTPNKGYRLHVSYGWSDNIFGSDYDYTNLNIFAYAYYLLSKKLVGGLRYEMQQVFGDTPFYLLPYLDIRGVPIARYQGNVFSVVEAELRWDFTYRWSLVGFGGTGKAYDSWSAFSESDWIGSGGGGFRYLMARLFKLRVGIDVAKGPEQWAYYIVMGSAWTK